MKRYALALDLKDDPSGIEQYDYWHRHVWPEVKQSIVVSGITLMEIYRTGNRLFMMMEVNDAFSFEDKAKSDAVNVKVQEWEELMWKFQQPLPWAMEGEKWILMERVFELNVKTHAAN